MPYRCDFEADEPPENPDRVIDGAPFLYHPTAGPDGPGRTAERFDSRALPRDRPGDPGRILDWLRSRGATAVRVTFDGGNDEGFARFGAGLVDGDELPRDLVIARLAADGAGAAIAADRTREGELWGPAEHAAEALWDFAEELCCRYFYEGWGTGPFLLFGAFEADLITGRFTDLRDVEKPEDIGLLDLPPRFPPGYLPPAPPPPPRGLLSRLFEALRGRPKTRPGG